MDTAKSGAECIRKAKENSYDMILLDYMMPRMDGIETIRELKKDKTFETPVIALSADVTKGIEQTFLKEGFCAYLSKPVMWKKLEDLLLIYLKKEQVFIRKEDTKQLEISKEQMKQISQQLNENDIVMEDGLKLLEGDFMQYRKLMEFFAKYQENNMEEMYDLIQQKSKNADINEITRMMHTLKSNAKAIGAMNLYEIARKFESKGKQNDMMYLTSGWSLLQLEWKRALKAAKTFLKDTENMIKKPSETKEKENHQSREELKESLKILITRYQAKEANDQIKYLLEDSTEEKEKILLKEIAAAIDQLDFDEAETLIKRWEGTE